MKTNTLPSVLVRVGAALAVSAILPSAFAGPGETAAIESDRAETAVEPACDDPRVTVLGENRFAIDAALLFGDGRGTNGNVIACTNTRVVPYFENGQRVGMKLYAIREGSLLACAGLRNGDVLLRVNGLPLTNPEEMLAAYERIRSTAGKEHTLSVRVARKDRRITLTYEAR